MGLELVQRYGGQRVGDYPAQPLLEEQPETQDEDQSEPYIDLNYEKSILDWEPIDFGSASDQAWDERPVYFVDGKDVGRTVVWMRAPSGHPVPVRLSQIGSVVMRVEDGQCRRVFCTVERVVTLVADLFPWDQIEGFASDLRENNFRLLIANSPEGYSYDFEKMRRITQDRSIAEMRRLEEIALSRVADCPTVADGRLEPVSGGIDRMESPVFGVIKSHNKIYLNSAGMQMLYQLRVGQRTPIFTLPLGRFPVASWYVRLVGSGEMPNWGVVRVEASLGWLETQFHSKPAQSQLANRLSNLISRYRSREQSYRRAPVSLHPIVRAEESLGATFSPQNAITHQFYRLLGI